ncbi:MAG TPA: glycerol-3-phosphate dehydrogenase, partial [Deltaproteobacteria bacterium]|nr:glycerol-3-phosphate dehydrogenase [Deltaproteobacteria bacterium]HCP46669.1 glycerol-3-phosphate dehydrogenase [Deltaproteobacteria bacterium]
MTTSRLPSPESPPFNRQTRDRRFAEASADPFDLIVIGGGITGAGIARDAAMRGLRTVLVEKGDIASGTSSASSKLVHGGLRYLEQGAIGLVFESVTERHRLRLLAPHLVRPLPFVFPVYGKKPRPLWMVRLGLWMYDAMALFRAYRLHRGFGSKRTTELEPTLRRDGLDGCVLYYDCLTDDARLTLETARAAHEAGAWILSYSEAVDLIVDRRQVTGVEVVDRLHGMKARIQARAVVNATGPWSDRTVGLRGDRPRMLRPTKGIHLVVARDRLPVQHAVVISNSEDQRVVFAVPWGNRVMLGTTDTDYTGDYDQVHSERDEIDYLLALTNRYFPESDLGPADVLGTFAGLRPLVGGEGTGPSDVSREHTIRVEDDGLISVAGGKLTTYRLMAAEVLKVVAKRLRTQGVHVGGCHTGSVRLPGGHGIAYRGEELITLGPDGAEAEQAVEDRLGKDVAEHLQESYGGRWTDVAA